MSAYGNDCHFFYNSTCTKGDSCAFRHCEQAKSCFTTCTFWQQGICSKPNCPYRHADLQPTERNRQAIACYWENQPLGCSRPNCQYQHYKQRPVQAATPSVATNPIITEAQLPDTSIPPPMFGHNTVSKSVPLPGVPVIQPVVVNFSDSEIDSENSPVKNKKPSSVQSQNIKKTITTVERGSNDLSKNPADNLTASKTTIPTHVTKSSGASLPDLDYFIGRPFANKLNKSSPKASPRYDSSPDRRSYDSRYSRSPSPRSLSPWRRRSRSPSPRRSRSPRRRSPSFSRDRSRSPRRWSPRRRSPSPRRYGTNKNAISRPQDRFLENRRPVYERLYRGRNDLPSSSKRESPVAISPKKISLGKIKNSTDPEGDQIKVKSLEEIQRAKALLSMGLVELKSGKIVKVGEVNKYKEEEKEEKEKDKAPMKKKIVKKVTKSKKPEKKTVAKRKKLEKKEEVMEEEIASQDNHTDNVGDEDENVDEFDDLGEEPEIDICEATEDVEGFDSQDQEESNEEDLEEKEEEESEEGEEAEDDEYSSGPEPVEYVEDIRRAVRKDIETKISPSQLKRKRMVIMEEEKQKEPVKQKISIHSRLGRKLHSTDTEKAKPQARRESTESKVVNLQRSLMKASSKSRIKPNQEKSFEAIGSSNMGTIKLTSGGIRSRLGVGARGSGPIRSEDTSSEPKKIPLKRTIDNSGEEEDKKEVVKRRRWNQSSVKNRLGQSSSDTNVTDNDLKKIVITRKVNIDVDTTSNDGIVEKRQKAESTSGKPESQVKSTLSRINKIIEEKRDSQEQGPQKKKKLNIWSSRVSESIAAVAPTQKELIPDLQDSSSNDSLPSDSVPSRRDAKLNKKLPKIERALYVPPARKRTVTSYDEEEEREISPPKAVKKLKEKKSEPEKIKTYSQIMEEKRRKLEKQREKKAKSEEKAKKNIKPVILNDKENETVLNKDVVSTENESFIIRRDSSENKLNMLDEFDFSLPAKSESAPQLSDSTSDHIDLLSALVPENSKKEKEDVVDLPASRRTSDDSWLEFSKEDLDMTGCETADDDDLLREIDELLA